MPDIAPESTIRTIRATVQSIELKLRHGDLPEEGLADLKAAIDDARLRLWAVISAADSATPEDVLLRFRLRRATEICRSVTADIGVGGLGAHQRELMELREAVQAMLDRLTAAIRGGT
jgi:hypothetical protein